MFILATQTQIPGGVCNRYARRVPVMLAGLAILLAAILFGCRTSPAYRTLYATGHGVDAAVSAYYGLVVDGKAKTNGVPKVSKLYSEFQVAYRLALELAQFNPSVPPDSNLVFKSTALLKAIEESK